VLGVIGLKTCRYNRNFFVCGGGGAWPPLALLQFRHCITTLVRAGRPRAPSAGALAWRGELEPHASSRGVPRLRDGATFVWAPVPPLRPSCAGLVLVGDGNYSFERVGWRRRGGNSSRGTETPRARWRLIVRGGDLSEKPPPIGDLLEKPPTGRRQDVLLVKVLTGICSPPYVGS
jgi:hypothetical protein